MPRFLPCQPLWRCQTYYQPSRPIPGHPQAIPGNGSNALLGRSWLLVPDGHAYQVLTPPRGPAVNWGVPRPVTLGTESTAASQDLLNRKNSAVQIFTWQPFDKKLPLHKRSCRKHRCAAANMLQWQAQIPCATAI